MTMMEAALAYARRGWAVFPLGVQSKEPAVKGAYKAATRDEVQVRRWWQHVPEGNIGLATGAVSGLWVLDIDGPEGEASFAQLVDEHDEELAETLMASTGKGYHLYWRMPQGAEQGRRIGVRPGIDIIGGQGYLVAPPSVHPSGRVYRWLNPEAVPLQAPQWLFDLQRPRTASTGAPRIRAPRMRPEGVDAPEGIQDARRYLGGVVRRAVADVVGAGEGQRNVQLFRAAAWVVSVAAGLGQDASSALGDLYRAAQVAGLEDEEIERTLDSAASKGLRSPMRGGSHG